MLTIVRTAAELTLAVNEEIAAFPEEERYVMVPMIRDSALSVLENSALGMARFEVPYRYALLTRALTSLNELSSHFVVCKRVGLVSQQEHDALKQKAESMGRQLAAALKIIDTLPIEPLEGL